MADLLFFTLAETAARVRETSSRSEKTALLADVLRAGGSSTAPIIVELLTGEIRQGRIGVGWAAIRR